MNRMDPMASTTNDGGDPTTPSRGSHLADVSTALVQLYRRFYGRGPTRAKTVAEGDVLTTVLAEIFTTVEETLVERGHSDLVVGVRASFQNAMRHEFITAVEVITGRTVQAFSSGLDVDHAVATETFVFEPLDASAPSTGPARQADPSLRDDVRERARATRSDAAAVRAEAQQAAAHRRSRRPQDSS
jgi:uncharacterized protein YbcI